MTDPNADATVPTAVATPPPVVCDLTGAPDTVEQRLDEYARLLAAAFVSRERTDTVMRWVLRADPGIERWVRDLAARETACCAFLTITVTVTDDGHVLWDTTTIDDPAARAVVDLMYDLPAARWNDVGEMQDHFVRTTGVPVVDPHGTITRPATPG